MPRRAAEELPAGTEAELVVFIESYEQKEAK